MAGAANRRQTPNRHAVEDNLPDASDHQQQLESAVNLLVPQDKDKSFAENAGSHLPTKFLAPARQWEDLSA